MVIRKRIPIAIVAALSFGAVGCNAIFGMDALETREGPPGGGGGEPTDQGASVTGDVNAGSVVSTPKYRLVFTLGQSSPHQQVTNTSKYRLQGGLIGVAEK
jgi:hypothetical protein